jgi:plasmid maintenance system antidote protein VapI
MGSQYANRIQFKRGYQKEFFIELQTKTKLSQRKLAEKLKVSRRTLRNWINEIRLLPENIFYRCVKILPELMRYRMFIINIYPAKWGRIKGGKIRGKMKNNLTQKLRIKGFRIANQKTIKRKVLGPNGEKMYNLGEKRLAELLMECDLNYRYEPVIKLGGKYAFPDFLVKNSVIIERCGYSDWPGYWNRILKKAKLYEKYFKGKFIIVVPDNRFNIAVKKVGLRVKNVIILKESSLEILPNFIMRGL